MIQENDKFKEYQKMIDKINELLIQFDEQIQQNLKVAMLVGNTANGKSTLFNFLSGFEFQITKKDNIKTKYLTLKYPDEKYASDMANGVKSVTKEPHYYFNKDNNYLLIDFPGFNDTEGAMQQFFVQVLFNRIVIKTPIRIIFVVKIPDGNLANRGVEFQDFISRCFAQHIQEFSQVTLILNQYMDNLDDQDLIDDVKNQLKDISKNVNENIAVVRKIREDSDLEMKFNNQKRQEIWNVIEKSNPIRFKPTQFKKQDELASLIHKKCDQIIQNLVSEICKQIDNFLNDLSKEDIEKLYQKFHDIKLLVNEQTDQQIFCRYQVLLKQMQEIAEILGWQNNQKIEIDTFLKIFKFVSKEEDIIEIKDFLEKNSQLLKNNLIIQKDTILKKIMEVEKRNLEDAERRRNLEDAETRRNLVDAERRRNSQNLSRKKQSSCQIM
ncbi:unnamed protein product [Paramecium primaurelia]|uniref:G domain-containing protein n=1 Tax=Paramecium primaurelia TaxID=5886 RepID=A0A8S1QMT5_PARPR|nr:unnamed protein product [Paramecium primaurelia]